MTKRNILVSHHHAVGGRRIKYEIDLVRVKWPNFFGHFESYNHALDALKDKARSIGGDAVINVAFDREYMKWIEGFVVVLE